MRVIGPLAGLAAFHNAPSHTVEVVPLRSTTGRSCWRRCRAWPPERSGWTMVAFRVGRSRPAQQLEVHDAELAKRAGRALVAADERIRGPARAGHNRACWGLASIVPCQPGDIGERWAFNDCAKCLARHERHNRCQIGRGPIKCIKRGGANPSRRRMLPQGWLRGWFERASERRESYSRMVVLPGRRCSLVPNADPTGELLVNLASQRILSRFALLYLASRKLPHPSRCPRPRCVQKIRPSRSITAPTTRIAGPIGIQLSRSWCRCAELEEYVRWPVNSNEKRSPSW